MKSFSEIYGEIYKESNEKLEGLRKQVLKREITVILLIIFFLIAITILFYTKHELLSFLLVIIAIVLSFKDLKKRNVNTRYEKLFKEEVFGKFISEYNSSLSFEAEIGTNVKDYEDGEFENFNAYYTENSIKGLLNNGCKIHMAEVRTEGLNNGINMAEVLGMDQFNDPNRRVVKSFQRNDSSETVFSGLFAKIEIEKAIPNTIKIRKDSVKEFLKKEEKMNMDSSEFEKYFTVYAKFAKIEIEKAIPNTIKIRKDSVKEFLKKEEKMNMDSSEFEKYFTVYAKDEIVAMQVLTADLMQIFIDFRRDCKLTPEVTLKNNNIYIRFDTGRIFNENVHKKALDFDALLKYYKIMNFTLRLSEKISKNLNELDV